MKRLHCVTRTMKHTMGIMAVAAGLCQTSSATLFVKDSIVTSGTGSYTAAGTSLAGQGATNGTIGVSGSWDAFATGVFLVETSGLAYPGNVLLDEFGGTLSVNAISTSASDGRILTRAINGLPTSGTLYFSALLSPGSDFTDALIDNHAVGVGIGTLSPASANLSTPRPPDDGIYFAFQNIGGTRSLVGRVKGTPSILVTSPTANQTYFCVAKVEIGAGPGGQDIVHFAVDPSQPDDYTLVTTNTVLAAGTTFTRMAIAGTYRAGGKKAFFDEIRVGSSWMEVAEMDDDTYPIFYNPPTVTVDGNNAFEFSATLDEGSTDTSVIACYGTTRGGNTIESWDLSKLVTNTPTLGAHAATLLDNLTTNTLYYYDALATNAGYSVRKIGSTFLFGEVWLTLGQDAEEEGLVAGSLIVHRPASATQAPLTVAYTVGGTAVEGVNYAAGSLSGTVTIPAGQDTATVSVMPLMDAVNTDDTTVVFTLAAGPYLIGTASSTTVTIQNFNFPADKNCWIGSGNASVAGNWSQGVPEAGDDILLGVFSSGAMTWDAGVNGLPDTVASWTQTFDYTGTVTFPIQYTNVVDADFTTFTITGNALIENGAWTHPVNGSSQTYRLKASINGDLIVAADGVITATGKGYSGSSGGKSNGSHGGNANGTTGQTYGNPKYPTDIGARYATSAGGGAILLDVAGAVTINGSVVASGMTANVLEGGAGGSILIIAPDISGSGSIAANGAMGTKNDWFGNAGSGGRIALLTVSPLAFPTNQITAFGRATGSTGSGTGAGTIFLKHAAETHGTLVVHNSASGQSLHANRFKVFSATAVTPVNVGEIWTFDRVLTRGYGVLSIPEGTSLILPNGLASVSSLDTTIPVMNGLRYDGGMLDIGSFATQVISGGWCFQAASPYTINGNLSVTDGASVGINRLRQLVSLGIGGYRGCDLTVTGNMTVDDTSFIEARYGGFWDNNSAFHHVTHGGVSGYTLSAVAHDSILNPARPAGGVEANEEFYAGGGVVKLTVGGNLHLDGIATSDGFRAENFVDLNVGSPGGAFNFTLGSISGSGSISAKGGINTRRMGTGGGRIAIRLTDPSATFDAWRPRMHAFGRTVNISSSYEKSGSAGTIYLQTSADGEGRGLIIVKNDNNANNLLKTPIPATGTGADSAEALKEARLSLENCGRVILTADLKLTALTIETNTEIDLAGRHLIVTAMTHNGSPVPTGSYAAADFATGVSDSSVESLGNLTVLGQATLLLIR